MRKGAIACYKQFLLFSQCFQPYISLIQGLLFDKSKVPEENFFKELHKIPFPYHGNQSFSWNQIPLPFLKGTFQGTFLLSVVEIGQAVWEKKMFKEIVDDGHQVILNAPLEHVLLR